MMPEHTITTDCVWRNWLGGTVDGLPFAAKICDVNSPDGIDNRRVLKLFLYTEGGEQRGQHERPDRLLCHAPPCG